MVHGIKCAIDLHPQQVVLQVNIANMFNYFSKCVMFQELKKGGKINQLIFFVNYFHAFEFPLYFT